MQLFTSYLRSFTGRPPRIGRPSDATILFGFSFGYAIDAAGRVVPGSCNEQIADTIVELSRSLGIHTIIAQEEVAMALRAKGVVLPETHVFATFVPHSDGRAYTTIDMWRRLAESNLVSSSDIVMPVAQAYHLPRVLYVGARFARCVSMPAGYRVALFPADSQQPWTTSLARWRKNDVTAYWRAWTLRARL